jgi:hypothetical protein
MCIRDSSRIFLKGEIIKTLKGYRPAEKLMPKLKEVLDSLGIGESTS